MVRHIFAVGAEEVAAFHILVIVVGKPFIWLLAVSTPHDGGRGLLAVTSDPFLPLQRWFRLAPLETYTLIDTSRIILGR